MPISLLRIFVFIIFIGIIPKMLFGELLLNKMEQTLLVAYLRNKNDSEYLWHLRSEHLGFQLLRTLIKHARGIYINGIKRVECEYCIRIYAK